MKSALPGIARLVVAGAVAASCGTSSGPGAGHMGGDTSPKDGAASGGCGASGEACCNGTACDNGLSCQAGSCVERDDTGADFRDATSGGDATGVGDGAAADAGPADATADSSGDACGGGEYKGPLSGLYTSHLFAPGIPVPVAGQVHMTLGADGRVQTGTVSGAMDSVQIADAQTGFPFSCSVNGSLDCTGGVFKGWMECTYCIGPVADGGNACSVGGGAGGHYAGTFTATYDFATHAFVTGRWNGAEALAGNDGGSPGPDGGPASSYLADSGLYLGPGDFGGSGSWSAARQ